MVCVFRLYDEAVVNDFPEIPVFDSNIPKESRNKTSVLIARHLRGLSEISMRADCCVSSSLIEVAALTIELEGSSKD